MTAQRGTFRGRGFTLIELVIVIAIVGILAGVFNRYLTEGNRMFLAVDARRELLSEARQAELRVLREIRQVRSPGDLAAADSQNFSFYGVDDSLHTIAFSGVPGQSIVLSAGVMSAVLARDVDSLAFEYFKQDGTPAVPLTAPQVTDAYRVGVYLRLRRGADAVAVRSGTWLRNVP